MGISTRTTTPRPKPKNTPKKKKQKQPPSKGPSPSKKKLLVAPRLTPWHTKSPHTPAEREGVERLHKEIVQFEAWISPTPAEWYAREGVVRKIQTLIIKKLWPDANTAELKPFGSFETGLLLPTSDIDLVIVIPSVQNKTDDDREESVRILRKISRLLWSLPGIAERGSVTTITKARVPIIKFVDKTTGYNVDLSVNVESGLGGARMIQKSLGTYPALRPLYLVLKHFLGLRHLNEVYKGGLGSYGLLCLLLSFLQMHPLVQGGVLVAEDNLGVLLLDFLELYGCHFNYRQAGISLQGRGSYFSRKERGWLPLNNELTLCIEDPQDLKNDVCKSSFAFSLVRDAFEHAFHALADAAVQTAAEGESVLGKIVWSSATMERHRSYIQQTTNI